MKNNPQPLSPRAKWLPRILAIPVIALIVAWPVCMPNGVAGFSNDPYERYLAEKVLEYRTQYNKEHGFKKPLNMRVVSADPRHGAGADDVYRSVKYCGSIPRQHFNELFDAVYSKTFYVHEYTWFGDHQPKIVLGCALYKVGV